MLKILFRDEELAHPLQAICPWLDFITSDEGIVLDKDGSMLAAFEYAGVDPDNLYEEKVNFVTEQLQSACMQFDARITAWWIVDKRRDHSYPENTFINSTAKELDDIYHLCQYVLLKHTN